VLIGVFLSPLPKRLGFWKSVFHRSDPALIGILPCSVPSEADWGFTFDDLYGDGGFEKGDEKVVERYQNRLRGQTALVTGANSGTGYEVSLALARLGVRVTMACRNPIKCEAAADRIRSDPILAERSERDGDGDGEKQVTTMTVDVSSLKSVREFSEAFLSKLGGIPLDMLFLNAGIPAQPLTLDGTNRLTEDGIEIVFATNVVGHHLMTKLLLEPTILTAPRKTPARIVLTSSAASYDSTYDFVVPTDLETINGNPNVGMSHYGISKLAQILWARELTVRLDAADAKEDDDDPNAVVYVNAAHPGAVATEIWGKGAASRRDAAVEAGGTPDDVGFVHRLLERVFAWMMTVMWTCEEGALTLVYLGTAVDDLRQKNVRGRYFHPQSIEVTDHPNVYGDEDKTNALQKEMWDFLDDLVAPFSTPFSTTTTTKTTGGGGTR